MSLVLIMLLMMVVQRGAFENGIFNFGPRENLHIFHLNQEGY